MTDPLRKRAHVLKSFTDAGTGLNYEKGDTPLIEAGAFANYQAAGLLAGAPDEPETEAAPAPVPTPAKRRE